MLDFLSQGFYLPWSVHADLTFAPAEFHPPGCLGVVRALAGSGSAIPPTPGAQIPSAFFLVASHAQQLNRGLRGPCIATRNVSRTQGQLYKLLSPELLKRWTPSWSFLE